MKQLETAISQIKTAMPALTMLENEPMSLHSSFKIGGSVRAYAVPKDKAELVELCRLLKVQGIKPMLLGNGTNILFPDEGLPQVFIISTEKLTDMYLTEDGCIYAEAGVSLAKLASFALQNELAGLEFASGIPGSLGGALIMNAGAYGGEMKDAVASVESYYVPSDALLETDGSDCDFVYRGSKFKKEGGHVLLSAKIRLERGDREEISSKMRELNARRRDKQPLDLPSAGSAFKRPEGYFAAALIDEAGLKGFSIGGAQVSEKHAGFVVNKGGATAKDVRELLREVQARVKANSGIELEAEIIMLPPDYKVEK